MKRSLLFAASALFVTPWPAFGQPSDSKGTAFFESKIRPVLVAQCYQCHSAGAKRLRGSLLLDSRAGLRKGGDSGPALVPGKAAQSLLLKALRHQGDVHMPPKGKLPDAVIADFARWIEMGAPDPRDGTQAAAKKVIDLAAGRRYWAFRPLGDVPVPAVKSKGWGRTPVDAFILARLEEKGLTPNPLVAREKLARRAFYDLLGLPPTPAELKGFLDDTAPDAYEKLIDRLLASDHYGERWARHWLDVVRFAESGGYEFDNERPGAYHYRDFVIKALNQDMPFDEFVRLQVAGDHLRPGDFLATSATGFLVAGPFPGQTTAKTLELIRYNHLDDMASTLGNAMLGLSVGCARCHDHKYDPIPQQDYYRLLANLARTDSADVKLDLHPDTYRQAKADFDRAHAPLVAARAKFEKETLPSRLQKWLQTARGKPTPRWLILDMVEAKGRSPLKRLDDGSLLATGKADRGETYTLVAHIHQKTITALRIEGLPDASLPQTGPGRGPQGDFLLTDVTLTAAPLPGASPAAPKKGRQAKQGPVKLRAVRATSERDRFPLKAAVDGDKKTGWTAAAGAGQVQAAVFATEGAAGFEGGTVLTLTLKFEGGPALGRFRVSISTTPGEATLDGETTSQNAQELLAALESEGGQLTPKNRAAVARWYRAFDAEAGRIYAAEEQHAKQEPRPQLLGVFAAASGKGGDVYHLIRGEVERKNGVASPGFVQVLMTAPEQDARWVTGTGARDKAAASPRVGLANWLCDTEHGAGNLLARVIVNRLWQHHLGRGIVATPNDFGAQGEPPTHPELLDWLARELIKGGWRLKAIHKRIMTSAVYMQGGEVSPEARKADPGNRLWWRRPARRLEGEAIRDAVLAVSDTLSPTMYGPGTLDENSPRRSVYLKVKRSQMVPLLQMFDAPEAIQSIGERPTTTVATQSLAFLNSPFVRGRAEKLAQRVRPKAGDSPAAAIEQAYLIALSRRPSEAERGRMLAFVQRQAESYRGNARATDMALTDFCQVLLCLNEFVYVD